MVKIEYSQSGIDDQAMSFIKIVLILLFLASAYKFVYGWKCSYIIIMFIFHDNNFIHFSGIIPLERYN